MIIGSVRMGQKPRGAERGRWAGAERDTSLGSALGSCDGGPLWLSPEPMARQGATQRGSRKAAEVAKAEAEAGGRGSGAGQRGAKQSGASAEQRGGAKAAKDAEAVADA